MWRTIRQINIFKQKAERLTAEKILAFATSAVRQAKNRNEFADLVANETGLKLRIVSGEEEAKIFYRGVTADFPDDPKLFFVALNIGGGSSEISLGKKSFPDRVLSLPLGVVTLNEQFLESDPPTEEEYAVMVKHLKEVLDQHQLTPPSGKKIVFLHTGGELTYIRRIKAPTEPFEWSPSHPVRVDLKKFAKFDREKIRHQTQKQLGEYYPENPLWMTGAIASNALALTLGRQLGVDFFVPSDKNLADGLVLEVTN